MSTNKRKTRDKPVNKVRVWWPPTKDKNRTGYSGAYWPANVLSKGDNYLEVEYDNGDKERVDPDNIFPYDVPINFGDESRALEVGEFVEVSNNSKTDPCAWLGMVDKLGKTIKVKYPFHDSPDEWIKPELLRRARVWDDLDWKFIELGQSWKAGEVTSPIELNLVTEKEYFKQLNAGGKRKRAAAEAAAAEEEQDEAESEESAGDSEEGESSGQEGTSGVERKPPSAKKRANPRKAAHPARAAIDEGSTGSDAKKEPMGAKRRKPARVRQAPTQEERMLDQRSPKRRKGAQTTLASAVARGAGAAAVAAAVAAAAAEASAAAAAAEARKKAVAIVAAEAAAAAAAVASGSDVKASAQQQAAAAVLKTRPEAVGVADTGATADKSKIQQQVAAKAAADAAAAVGKAGLLQAGRAGNIGTRLEGEAPVVTSHPAAEATSAAVAARAGMAALSAQTALQPAPPTLPRAAAGTPQAPLSLSQLMAAVTQPVLLMPAHSGSNRQPMMLVMPQVSGPAPIAQLGGAALPGQLPGLGLGAAGAAVPAQAAVAAGLRTGAGPTGRQALPLPLNVLKGSGVQPAAFGQLPGSASSAVARFPAAGAAISSSSNAQRQSVVPLLQQLAGLQPTLVPALAAAGRGASGASLIVQSDIAAANADVESLLATLDLTAVRIALKERYVDEAYLMLVECWRTGSPMLVQAINSFKTHVAGRPKPDYIAFIEGIFGPQSMRLLELPQQQYAAAGLAPGAAALSAGQQQRVPAAAGL